MSRNICTVTAKTRNVPGNVTSPTDDGASSIPSGQVPQLKKVCSFHQQLHNSFSTAANVVHLATASADIWQVAARKQTAPNLGRIQMLTCLLISLHHILHKKTRIMPQTEKTIYSNVCNRLASCTVHNTIPLNAIKTSHVSTFQTKTSAIK